MPTATNRALEEHYNVESFFRELDEEAKVAFFGGRTLRIGEKAPNFRLQTVDGDYVELDDVRKQHHVAVLFGCASAPPCVKELPGYEAIQRVAASLGSRLVFVYTREIHPNEALPPKEQVFPHHRTMEQKTAQARSFRDDHDLTMTMCVDDLEGTTHRAYGLLPHLMAVVHRDGTLVHRSAKACAELLRLVLENMSRSSSPIELVHPRDSSQPQERHFDRPPTPTYCETLWLRE